jgi:transcription initiation factor TFIID subunit 5
MGLTGHTSQEIRSVNDQKVYTGRVVPENAFIELVEKRLKEEDEQTTPDIMLRTQAQTPTNLQQLYKEFKDEVLGDTAMPKDKSLPLPPKTTSDVLTELEAIKDLRYRVKLSARLLPSAVMYTFHNTYDGLNVLNFSKSCRMIAGGFADSYIKVWSLTGDKLKSLKGSTELAAVDFEHADDWSRGREPEGNMCKKMVGHAGPVYGVSFSPDDKYLISGSEDGTARLWSLDTFSNLVAYRGHNYPIWDVDFSPEGVYFATASHDRTARLWSCEHVNPLRIFAGHLSDVECVRFHPNSNYLATASADRSARLWDINRGRCVRVFTAGHPSSTATLMSLAVSPDGRTLATGADDGSIVIWDIAGGNVLKRYTRNTTAGAQGLGESAVYSLDFSSDGATLASGTADGIVSFWDTKRGGDRKANQPSMDDDVYGRK